MEVSVEGYFAVNALMSAAVFTLASRQAGRVRRGAVAMASVLSGAGAAAVQAGALPARFAPALMLLCALLALGRRSPGAWLRGLAACALWTCAFAGAALLMRGEAPLHSMGRVPLYALPVLLAGLCLTRGGRARLPERVRLRIATRMGEAEVTALVDTGNVLREPISGLPVVIVARERLNGILDPVCLDEDELLPPGFRLVRYEALGGGGLMRCFRPLSLKRLEKKRWIDAPEMWVAVYPGKMPGMPDALAPPAVAGR